jgi:hypothetical protein
MSLLAVLSVVIGLEGNPTGWLAGLLVLVWVGVLFGLPYMLLASVYGAKQGYLVIGASTFAVLILLGAIWLFGAPGTVAGTGPRGREPAWAPFTPDSEQAKDFSAVATFPNGWDKPGKKYKGSIDSTGEVKNIESVIQPALAERAASQGTAATKPEDWTFRTTEKPATPEEATLPFAQMYFVDSGHHLVAGAIIPATAKHPQTIVFAYHDTGQIFYWAAIILGAGVVGFASHIWALAMLEKRKKLPVSVPATT